MLEDVCPKLPKCRCNKETTYIDCSDRNFTSIPDIPNTVLHLNLERNKLVSIPTGAFSNLSNLQTLNLNDNGIRKVEPFAFEGLVNLTKLELRFNNIQTLGHKRFANIPKLQYLDVSNNWLQYSTNDSFYGTPELVEVNFEANMLPFVPLLWYQPNLQRLLLPNNRIKNATFPPCYRNSTKALHISLAQNRKMTYLDNTTFRSIAGLTIKGLTLAENNIKTVMSGTFEVFPSIKFLSLKNNPLDMKAIKNIANGLNQKGLVRLDVSGVFKSDNKFQAGIPLFQSNSITKLLLSRNSISFLPNNIFKGFKNVRLLNLCKNKLSRFNEESLRGLYSLNQIDLSSNKFVSFPKFLPNRLESVNLQGNQIVIIESNTTIHLCYLRKLILRHNKIGTIKLGAFEGLTNLEVLDLSQNEIATLPGDVFSFFRNLTQLDLSNNKLEKIGLSKRRFENLVSLRRLDLSGNKCAFLREDIFQSMLSLRYLHLERNELGDIIAGQNAEQLFKGLKKLEELYLMDNNIHDLPDVIFREQISLKILKVGENTLAGWGPNLFQFTMNLQILDVRHNQIGVITEQNLHHLNQLNILNLQDNPFSCGCDLLWFRGWIRTTKVQLSKLKSYKCKSPAKWLGKPLLELTEDKIQCTFYSNSTYIIIGSVSATLVCPLVLVALVYRHRWRLRLRLYLLSKRGRKFIGIMRAYAEQANYGAINDQRIYDAYISCSDEEYDWVLHHLLPGIDNGFYDEDNVFGGDFKLYFDPRDKDPGNMFSNNYNVKKTQRTNGPANTYLRSTLY